jgi:hypothetical protein
VIAAGVLANLLLAWTVLVAQGLVVGIPAGYGASPGCSWPVWPPARPLTPLAWWRAIAFSASGASGWPAARRPWPSWVGRIKGSPAQSLSLEVERQGSSRSLSLTPAAVDGIGKIGAQLQPFGNQAYRPARGPLEVIRQASRDTAALTGRTVCGFVSLATHFGETAQPGYRARWRSCRWGLPSPMRAGAACSCSPP